MTHVDDVGIAVVDPRFPRQRLSKERVCCRLGASAEPCHSPLLAARHRRRRRRRNPAKGRRAGKMVPRQHKKTQLSPAIPGNSTAKGRACSSARHPWKEAGGSVLGQASREVTRSTFINQGVNTDSEYKATDQGHYCNSRAIMPDGVDLAASSTANAGAMLVPEGTANRSPPAAAATRIS